MKFFKKNKYRILLISFFIILLFNFFPKVLGAEAREEEYIKNEVIILDVSNKEYAEDESLTDEEQEFLNLINANRENNGIAKLETDSEIQNIARLKAKDLVDNNYFSHVSPVYGNVQAMFSDFNIEYSLVGENIAGNNNLVGAVESWMNSAKHKENILNSGYNYTGVAVIEGEYYGKVFVQIFAKK